MEEQPADSAPAGPIADDQLWAEALKATADNPSLSWMANLQVEQLADDRLALRLKPEAGHLFNFVSSKAEQISQLIGRLAGRRVRVSIVKPDPAEAPAAAPRPRRHTVTQQDKEQAMRSPLVREIAQLFDATPVDIRRTPGPDDQSTAHEQE
jgi:hypothetical protein